MQHPVGTYLTDQSLAHIWYINRFGELTFNGDQREMKRDLSPDYKTLTSKKKPPTYFESLINERYNPMIAATITSATH